MEEKFVWLFVMRRVKRFKNGSNPFLLQSFHKMQSFVELFSFAYLSLRFESDEKQSFGSRNSEVRSELLLGKKIFSKPLSLRLKRLHDTHSPLLLLNILLLNSPTTPSPSIGLNQKWKRVFRVQIMNEMCERERERERE